LRLLLDTHVWIWSQVAPEKLSARVRRALENEANEVWLSPVSIWELVLLVEKRRIALGCDVVEWITKAVAPLKEAPVTAEIVLEMARFSLPHPDPAALSGGDGEKLGTDPGNVRCPPFGVESCSHPAEQVTFFFGGRCSGLTAGSMNKAVQPNIGVGGRKSRPPVILRPPFFGDEESLQFV